MELGFDTGTGRLRGRLPGTTYPGDFAACSNVQVWPDGASRVDTTAAVTGIGGVC